MTLRGNHLLALLTAASMAIEPNFVALTSLNEPRKEPIGVRTALTMKTS